MSEERRFLQEAMRELRAQKNDAVMAWLEGRHKIGAQRWTDKDALRAVRLCVERALLQDEWRDVLAAVREVARDPFGTPWKIEGVCSVNGSERREREHNERVMRERREGWSTGV